MKAGKFLLPIIILIAATIYFSVFIVKEINQAIVLQFGDPKRIISKPGINFKIPFIQNVVLLILLNFIYLLEMKELQDQD